MIIIRSFILVITLIVLTFNVFGQEIQQIKKGEGAPFDGFIIDTKMETKMRTYREENKKTQEVNIELKSLGELQDIRYEIYKKNADTLTDENNKLQTQKSLSGVMYFILGAVITGGISYGVIKTLK